MKKANHSLGLFLWKREYASQEKLFFLFKQNIETKVINFQPLLFFMSKTLWEIF